MSLDLEWEKVTNNTLKTEFKYGLIPGNAGAIALNNYSIAIDSTYFPSTGRLLKQCIQSELGLPIMFVFLTHYHGDHYFGLAPFKGQATIISSRKTMLNLLDVKKTRMNQINDWKKQDPDNAEAINEIDFSLLPSIGFDSRLEIRDDDLIVEFYHAGGHTSGSSYAYFPYEKVVFAGDLIFAKNWPYAADPTCNPEEWITALETIYSLNFEYLVPGHGPIVDKCEIKKHISFFKELKDEIKSLILYNIDLAKINVPEFYDDVTQDQWCRKSAIQFWFEYYKNLKHSN
ncbi:MAG: MBL fold metallo-hydrolase [Candidatus Hodarchaeota archaeon]